MDATPLLSLLQQHGQQHLIQFWSDLNQEQQQTLLNDLESINFEEVTDMFQKTISETNEDNEKLDDRLQPIPSEIHGSITRTSPEKLKLYENEGK